MGRNRKKDKQSAQPEHLMLSGEMSAGLSGSSASEVSSAPTVRDYEINVIRLLPDVLEKANLGDKVTIDSSQSPFSVFIDHEKVGEIPQRNEAIIKNNQLFQGIIVDLKKNGPYALRIRLTRWTN